MKKIIACCLFLSLLGACGTSRPTKFYTLSSIKDEKPQILDTRKITIGVDTINVAGYLERPQIVTLSEGSELNMSEYNRWAEPLSYSIQRVVAENISSNFKNGIAVPLNSSRGNYSYIVDIELNKLDGKLNQNVQLDAWWNISKAGNIVAREHSTYTLPTGDSYNEMIENQNQLLKNLSTDISKKISKLK